jgi:hypothetical protein
VLGQNPPEIASWERGEWWLTGVAKRWQPAAMSVVGGKLVFRPRLTPGPDAQAPGCGVNRPLSAEPRVAGPGAA